jgi:methylated-DNA-protein-cysteine methyltransferase-like protein
MSEKTRQKVWRLIRVIPRGKVATYGDIARAVGPPCTPRLVGQALRQSSAALRLPWHRVLAAGGRIALPGASGLEQRLRLQAEGVLFSGSRVRIELHHAPPTARSLRPSGMTGRG